MTNALVILCGGMSTRMGCDKTFLPFGEQSLLAYQMERFRPFFSQIYLSVPAKAERPIDYASLFDCPVIEDCYSQIGPLGGLYSCLSQAKEDILFFTSVDAPFTDPSLAQKLCDVLSQSDNHHICTIANPEGFLQPLFTAYKKSVLTTIESMIQNQIYKLQYLLKQEQTLVVDEFVKPEQFFNMNTRSDYYYALQQLMQSKNTKKDSCQIPVISFTAQSGTGKTTYLEKLLPLLKEVHLRIAVIKHDAHGFQMDKPGKDSYRLTAAGADHMILTSMDQTAAIIQHKNQNQRIDELLEKVQDVDLILTEGYKLGNLPKIQLLRKGHCETPVGNQSNMIAYVTDFPFSAEVPVFDLNHPEQLVPFLLDYIH